MRLDHTDGSQNRQKAGDNHRAGVNAIFSSQGHGLGKVIVETDCSKLINTVSQGKSDHASVWQQRSRGFTTDVYLLQRTQSSRMPRICDQEAHHLICVCYCT
ncbi:hypothetical protein D5086_001623 [Populus alba]|uniref:Uncharacterized protein n=1 Tax=Populus alba TaxID=43335 RepID=A0ACC4CZP0_POPAL